MKLRKVILFLIGLFVLIIALWKFDFVNNFNKVENLINWYVIIICGVIINSVILLRAYRWKYMMAHLKIREMSLWESMKIVGPSFFFASITTSRIGEISKVLLTKEKKKTLAAFGIEYLGDFIAVIVVPAFFLMIYLNNLKSVLLLSGFTLTVLIIILIFHFLKNKVMDKVLSFLFPNQQALLKHKRDITKYFDVYIRNRKVMIRSIAIGVINYLVFYIIGYLVFLSLGIKVNFLIAITGLALAQIVGIITFIPLGLGTRELSALGFFMLQGFDSATIINGLIILRLLSFLPILFGYFLYLVKIKK